MTATRAVWLFVIAITLVRLATLGTADLEFDEAHYWMWSERLAPAFFSKGPGVAFAIRASTALFGPTEFGVRFFGPILAAGTTLLLFYFGKRLFGETAGLWTAISLNAAPIFNIGAFLMTIDPLSIFFWTAAMFTFWIACERISAGNAVASAGRPQFSWWWPATGLLIGLGFLSKYTNALEVISILLVLWFAPRLRGEFKRPGVYVMLVVVLLCTIPPIVWNKQHAWITLRHLRSRGNLEHGIGLHPAELLKFFGEHFLVYSPILFLALAWAVLARLRRINQQFKVLFLFWFGAPVFVFYFLLSFNQAAAPNWDALAMIGFGLLAIAFWEERIASRRWLKPAATIGLAIGLLMSAIALDTDLLRTMGFRLEHDPSNRMRGWKSATTELEKIRHDLETKLGERLFLIADERDRASEISFYLRDKELEGPGHPPVYITESQDILNQFSFWPRYDAFVEAPPSTSPTGEEAYTEEHGVNPFTGRSALFIRGHEGKHLPHNISAAFQSTEAIGTISVERFGKSIRRWQVFLCRNYRTLPL